MTLFRSFSNIGHPQVDSAGGVIRGVSIITAGEARGHGVYCDLTTLMQVKACAEARGRASLAAKFNPQTFDHGPAGIAGHFDNFRISGTQLLADLYIDRNFASRDYLLSLATNQPGSFGFSIDFDMYVETVGGRECARCKRVDAATVVDSPAANTGLFSGPINRSTQAIMQTTSLVTATATGFATTLTKLQHAGLSRPAAIQKMAQTDREGFNAWSAAGRPNPSTGDPGASATEFSAIIRARMANGFSRAAAIIALANSDAKGFNRWCAQGRP